MHLCVIMLTVVACLGALQSQWLIAIWNIVLLVLIAIRAPAPPKPPRHDPPVY